MKTYIFHPNFHYLSEILYKKDSSQVHIGKIQFSYFPDGWPNIFFLDTKNDLEGKDVIYIGDFSRKEDFFDQYALLRGILDYNIKTLNIVIPFFPVGTMERISRKGEVATAGYFAELLSHLPQASNSKPHIHIFDIHSIAERFFFDSFRVNIDLHTTLSLIENKEKYTIVFPDSGSYKRFRSFFPDSQDIIICDKIRGEKDQRNIRILSGNPKGKTILIIDDIIQTGGTLRETARCLRENGALSISAFAPHGVFPQSSHISLSQVLDELIVTDTLPINRISSKDISNMRVLSFATILEKLFID